ncbi:Uncharacterised protein [uncultured archaeon]|nr:Uncharacterised protein [uncultured archaeon]
MIDLDLSSLRMNCLHYGDFIEFGEHGLTEFGKVLRVCPGYVWVNELNWNMKISILNKSIHRVVSPEEMTAIIFAHF